MKRVLLGIVLGLLPPLSHAGVIGNLDSAPVSGDGFQLRGWACSTGVAQSIVIHMYAGGPYGTGTNLGAATADQVTEAAVSSVCQTSGVRHRFLVTLPESVRQQHANKLIYVYGISPNGGANALLAGSGALRVPAPLSVTRRYVYGEDLKLCKVIEPETGATVSHYDTAGNLDWSASGLALPDATSCNLDDSSIAGNKVTRSYDSRNRITSLSFPNGIGNTSWTYDKGRVAAMTADNGGGQIVTTQYAYNARGMVTRESLVWTAAGINWPVDYAYNSLGHLSSQTWHGLTVDYAPNALGQATKAGTFASNVTYHPGGAIKQFTYGNGIVHTMTQNARGLPDRSVDTYPGIDDALDDSYAYDGNGNVVAILDGASDDGRGDRKMVYDGLDRLVHAESLMFGSTKTSAATYTYDGVDNLLRVSVPGTPDPNDSIGREHHYCYDAITQQLTNVMKESCSSSGLTVMGLEYDERGNLENRNGQLFDFDFGNRLRGVYTNAGATIATYVYDALGRRVRDATTASKYSQYSQSGQLVQASDARTGKFSEYVYLGGSLVAVRERTGSSGSYVYTTKYQHTDALGSPVTVTNASRNVIERFEYEPFGKVVVPVSPDDGPGFTGHVLDANTGLNYAQQRYYDPSIGRFLSVDPVASDGNGGGNFNRYWYANNNPYKFTDPDGRQAVCSDAPCDAAAGAAAFAGRQASDAGSERARYSAESAKLNPSDSAGRSALKADSRARTPSVVRAVVAAARPSTGAKPGTGGRANVSNPKANAGGTALKTGGRVLVGAAVVQQANEIANSPEPTRDVAGAGGMALGAIGGGEGGAAAGAAIGVFFGGPPGAVVGAIIGGLTGSAAGSVAGEQAAEALYDRSREN